MHRYTSRKVYLLLFIVFIFSACLYSIQYVIASTTDGTIDAANKWAWSENTGWIDFGTSGGNVHVTDTALTGYAYGENIGWISLNCSNTSSCGSNGYAVANNAEGTLSGYAWSENAGWIHFAPTGGGVTINASGVFTGSAYSENLGWIVFGTDHPVTTDWRPASTRQNPSGTSSTPVSTNNGGSGKLLVSEPRTSKNATGTTATSTATPGTNPLLINPIVSPSTPPAIPNTSVTNVSTTITRFMFSRDLTLRRTSPDVQALQKYLNGNGFIVASSGAGSPGNETNYFGSLTRSALIRFQEAHAAEILTPVGLMKGTGYFGPSTRLFINTH